MTKKEDHQSFTEISAADKGLRKSRLSNSGTPFLLGLFGLWDSFPLLSFNPVVEIPYLGNLHCRKGKPLFFREKEVFRFVYHT
jgi:hypothetical protein